MWFMMPQTLQISEGGDGLSVNFSQAFWVMIMNDRN